MSKFKVGDRVRFKEPTFGDAEIRVETGDYGIVTKVSEYFVSVKPKLQHDPSILVVAPDGIEIAEPTDRKAAFLEELRALLGKYDAMINVNWNEYFDTEGVPCIDVDFVIGHSIMTIEDALGKSITADNLMDYDEE